MTRRGTGASDEGSAVVDFVLVSLILIPLFVAIVQLGLALYVRNTLAACAQEGARYAADEDIVVQGAGVMADNATGRTAACIKGSLPDRFAAGITASSPSVAGDAGTQISVVQVQITSSFPLVGLFGAGPHLLHAKADAMQERV